jgi:hypothetical protein
VTKLIGSILLMLTVVVLLVSVTPVRSSSKEKGNSASGPVVEQGNKNIKVLNGMPESQLIPAMKFFTVSLGVGCIYCHVSKDGQMDTAADDKETKRVARAMIKMVREANASTFHGSAQVSCYTCHRGQPVPQSAPALPVALRLPSDAPAPSATPSLPSSDEILQKYIEAIGGLASLSRVKTAKIQGTVTNASGTSGTFELDQAAPGKGYEVVTTQRGTRERVLNGQQGWEKTAYGINSLAFQQLQDLKLALPLFGILQLRDQFAKFDAPTADRIDDHDVYQVPATRADGKRERLYFDIASGLLVRRISETASLVGTIPDEVDFADYREVEGIKIPATIRMSAVDTQNPTSVRKIEDVGLNAAIEETRFDKPK